MELVPWQFAWTGHADWLLLLHTENIPLWIILGTSSTLEALFYNDALCKLTLTLTSPVSAGAVGDCLRCNQPPRPTRLPSLQAWSTSGLRNGSKRYGRSLWDVWPTDHDIACSLLAQDHWNCYLMWESHYHHYPGLLQLNSLFYCALAGTKLYCWWQEAQVCETLWVKHKTSWSQVQGTGCHD